MLSGNRSRFSMTYRTKEKISVDVNNTTSAQLAFDALVDRLRPQCEAIAAQYEQKRSALLPMMHLFQEHQGYVSKDAMHWAAGFLDLTPAVVESVVSFY